MNIHKLTDINRLEYPTAVTVGMFDGVHTGHRHLLRCLQEAAQNDSLRPLVVTFDLHPRQVLSDNVPTHFRVNTNEERYALLAECGIEEVVEVHFDKETASLSACEFFQQVLVGRLGARAIVLGYDNSFGNRNRNDFDHLPALAQSLGVRLITDTPVMLDNVAVSSTQIRHALRAGSVDTAAHMLGYSYRLWGEVVRGRQMGRQLGFPTANVHLSDQSKIVPAAGVYAVRVTLPDGSPAKGMANFGSQPTFGLENTVFEVHILDFDGDLYGTTLHVEFIQRLRDIVRFSSIEQLITQLRIDRECAARFM